jgi:uncharacterized membrane protein YoaT (DUF817 family)
LWPADAPIARYDFLLISAIVIQIMMLWTGLETREEAWVILIFHITGTVMEIFKTSMGSWVYPEESFFRIGDVPLFTGFMYASVGSYLARVWKIFDFRFSYYPDIRLTWLLCILIYVNFFSHHFIFDMRWFLCAFSAFLFLPCRIYYTPKHIRLKMSLFLGFFLVALFIWFAEQLCTLGNVWTYPEQLKGWKPVGWTKLGAWFLLMQLSFVLITLVSKPEQEKCEK